MKTDDNSVYAAVEKTIRDQSKIWEEWGDTKGNIFEMIPATPKPAGLGVSSDNWWGKVNAICGSLGSQGYPSFSKSEIITVAKDTYDKVIADCQFRVYNDLKKKLRPSIASRMMAAVRSLWS